MVLQQRCVFLSQQRNLNMKKLAICSLLLITTMPDPVTAVPVERGEKIFRKCVACHALVTPYGKNIRKGGRVGPNLYGVMGRAAASSDYKYSKALKQAAGSGLVWTPEMVTKYVADPSAFLKNWTGNKTARSKMAYRLRNGGADVAAYLETMQ